MSDPISKTLYNDAPCERCGGEKFVSKVWIEEIKTTFGVTSVEVSQFMCKNKECQDKFEKKRQIEIEITNSRKREREGQSKSRKESIAKTIAERKSRRVPVSK